MGKTLLRKIWDLHTVRALPTGIIKGIDQQFTGKVERIDKDFVTELIDRQVVPVVRRTPLRLAECSQQSQSLTKMLFRLRPAPPGVQDQAQVVAAARQAVTIRWLFWEGSSQRAEDLPRLAVGRLCLIQATGRP